MRVAGEDGYELWLRYRQVVDPDLLAQYCDAIGSAMVLGTNASAAIAQRELTRALPALLGSLALFCKKPAGNALVVGMGDDLVVLAGPD